MVWRVLSGAGARICFLVGGEGLMSVVIFRPGRRIVMPTTGVQVWSQGGANAATWWNNNGAISGCVAAYQPKGAVDLASSYINLANPGTNNAAPGSAPTFNTSTGWTFNGSSQYLTTGITVGGSGWSAIVRFSNWGTGGFRYILGAYSSTGQAFLIGQDFTGSQCVAWNFAQTNYAAQFFTSGTLAIGGGTAYKNGSSLGAINAGTSAPTVQIYIGAANVANAGSNHAAVEVQAVAIYNTSLTSGQVGTITTAMQAL